MNRTLIRLVIGISVSLSLGFQRSEAREPIRMVNTPALSPDGSTLVFSWGGDLWKAASTGGAAVPLTRHHSHDRDPEFSPDGKQIAFASDREGAYQPFVMPAGGGEPRQVGYHTGGYGVQGWTADGASLLVSGMRDHHWRDAERFFLIKSAERSAEVPLFDAAGSNGSLSPDGKKLLFTREGPQWWRKGYKGSQDSQIWSFDRETSAFTKVLDPPGGAHWPLWKPDGKGFYYVGLNKSALNLREYNLDSGEDKPLTEFDDDSVVYPCVSRDGSTIVFRVLFDLYRYQPGKNDPPVKLEIFNDGDVTRQPIERASLTSASQVAFTKDGLEIAFIAGGDLWVMDTELKEPRSVTNTPEEERDPVFAPDGSSILFVSDKDGQTDVWKASRADPAQDWWRNESFKLEKVSQDAEVESDLRFSPDGSKIAFVKSRGDIWVMNADGKEPKLIVPSWNQPRFDWSPDGKWLAYSHSDADFNDDVWVVPLDKSREPFNISRHPDNESDPVWSPDGKVIAFTGRRVDREVDVYFVYLREEDDDATSRDRTLAKAAEKIKQARKKGSKPADAPKDASDKPAAPGPKAEGADAKKPIPDVVIDFDRIHERVRRVSIPDSSESDLFWSPDSKKLAFRATIEGKSGLYTIEPPDDMKPKLLSSQVGSQARWIEAGNQIVWLAGGSPASLTAAGKETSYKFRALQEVNWPQKYRAAFDICWRTMRDHWYDEKLGNRNWDAVRRKYADAAAEAPDRESFATVVNLMLGELNGSHLGFSATMGSPGRPRRSPGGASESSESWSESTAHFGVRFDASHKGPGMKVRDVIPGTPADHKTTRILPGEIILSVDGATIDPALDLTKVLNGPDQRDVKLKVRAADGKERDVIVRPVSFPIARGQLYDKWVEDNRGRVDKASEGKLGYLHIRGMDFVSFYKFEQELYAAGFGKDGLVIDVRENGGGSTADHLLTALTQPAHAFTVPRGGTTGYPQDRRVYATWQKPIVVLCNQNSFSNAEIFSHAIKHLKRGKLVGVPTAGGVISTGGTTIMDVGFLRLPTRGWFLPEDGEDMELHGAVPDEIVWPDPADFAKGRDIQIEKGVEVLQKVVKDFQAIPQPKPRKSTDRPDFRPSR